MGSTVSTGKLISAFRDTDGQPCYIMWEQSYEKNCYPHTPNWCARAIGGIEVMMKRIFGIASACEGGMLQGTGGRYITPESHVGGWLKELASPVAMHDLSLTIQVSEGWSATLTSKDMEVVQPAMLSLGYESEAAALTAGAPITVTLYEDSKLLSAIFNGEIKQAWNIIKSTHLPTFSHRDESLGYQPPKAKRYEVLSPRCLRVSQSNENILMQQADGSWRSSGWAYSIIGQFVRDLWEAEMREPGSYRSRIKALRDAIHAAPMLSPQGVMVVFDQSLPVEKYQQSSVSALLVKVNPSKHGDELHFNVPQDEDTLYSVTALPELNTKWLIPEFKSAPVAQLELLAG